MSLKCSGLYLAQFRLTSPHLLASGDGTKSATVIGDVYVHPSAKVHPTAKVVHLISYQNIYVLQYVISLSIRKCKKELNLEISRLQ
jgi:hypothetical protein